MRVQQQYGPKVPAPEMAQNSQLLPEHRTAEMLPDRLLYHLSDVAVRRCTITSASMLEFKPFFPKRRQRTESPF
jgi:hypothetical protein